jgi:hypothetical protein
MTFRSKPQYLSPVLDDIEWDTFLLFERVYRFDYDITFRHWSSYTFIESLDRAIKPVVIVTIYGGYGTNSYKWLRPDIDAIVAERNFDLLHHFFKQDILTHI